MSFEGAEQEFRVIKNQLASGKISHPEYLNRVNNLRLQEPSGTWWQIREQDGRWLKWNGTEWILGQPQKTSVPGAYARSVPAAPNAPLGTVKPPETLLELIMTVAKGIIPGFLKNLPLTILTIVIVWALHTYLLVVVNEGFNYEGTLVSQLLATSGHEITGTLCWVLIGYFVAILVNKIMTKDLGNSLSSLSTVPIWVSTSFQGGGALSKPMILAGAGIAALIGGLSGNRIVSLQLALLMLGALVAQQNSMFSLAFKLGWSDLTKKNQKSSASSTYNPAWAVMGITGAAIGWIATTVFPLDFLFLIIISVILTIVGIYLISQQSKNPVPHALLLVLVFAVSLPLLVRRVAADDGGYAESGSNFGSWIGSQGAGVAVVMGAPPAVGAAAGSVLGSTVAGTSVPAQPPAVGGTESGSGPYVGDQREFVDPRGEQHTATLQADGTWISDQGTQVDMDRVDTARKEYENGLKSSRADQAEQIAADTAKADADRRQLEAIKAAGDKAAKSPDDYRKMVEWQQEQDKQYADLYKRQGDNLNTLVKGAEYTVIAADIGVNILAPLTGPAGPLIKTGYTIIKNVGKNVSSSYQKGENLLKGAARGGLEAGYDLGFDALKKKLPSGPGNWEWKGFQPWKGSSTFVAGEAYKDAVKSATQSFIVKRIIKDPIKDEILKPGSDKLLGNMIGTYK